MARNKVLSSETRQSILVLRNEGYCMREIAKKLKISYNAVYYSLHRTTHPVSNQNRKRSGRPRCITEQEDKNIRVCSLNVSMSIVKRQLRDAGLQGRVPLSSVCVLLPILIFYFYWPVCDMAFSLQINYWKIIQCNFLDFCFRFRLSQLKCNYDKNYRPVHAL